MNILVCLKQILDPEIPPRDFQIDRQRLEAVRGSANLVANIFCENALETALKLRERIGGQITALSFGPASAKDMLRKALALKVDNACLVLADELANFSPDLTARALATAVNKLGCFDVIMVGREAGDWGAGQTGGLLAEELQLPCVAFVDAIEPCERGVMLRRQTEIGWERVEAPTPLVITVTNHEDNVPRIPKIRDIMMAKRKPITEWPLADLGLAHLPGEEPATNVVDLSIPELRSECEFISGETVDERVSAFAGKIAKALGQ
jgi:electron transfer flavoprotein beta subunit